MSPYSQSIRCLLAAAVLGVAACQPVRPHSQSAPPPTPAPVEEGAVQGRYAGNLSIAGMNLELIVTLTEDSGAYTGTIDIPQQNASGIPLHDISIAPPAVHFAMLAGPQQAVFEGTLAQDGSISGKMTQSGMTGDFSLKPDTATTANAGAPVAGVDSTYTDPQGRFSVPIPTNWTVSEQDGYVLLTDPEASLKVYLMAVASDAVSETVAAAWQQVEPGFDLELRDTVDAPPAPGVEKSVGMDYKTNDDNRFVQAAAQLKDGVTYVNLYDIQLAGLQKRQAQLGIISSGFKILGLEETDLSRTQPLTVTDEIVQSLEEFINTNLTNFHIPGAAVGIVQNGELVYAKGFGTANPETGAPITPDTHMMIGSTGKSLTTMMMATMVDDGLMSWDTPAIDLYPDFKVKDPALTKTVTMRNLVCACTGVPRKDFEWLFNATNMHDKDVVTSLADFEFLTDFGEAFQYSNQMVATAGYIAGAVASGNTGDLTADYVNALQTRVLDPIGMISTTLSFAEVEQAGDYATPHTLMLDNTYVPISLDLERPLSLLGPAGGHWSTLNDMARYMITQLNDGVAPDGNIVVSPANLNVTREPQIAINANSQYGLGWMISTYKGQPMITHGGNTLGFTSEFTFLPKANLGVIVLTNARASNIFNGAVSTRLLELVFDQEPQVQKTLDFYQERLAIQVNDLKKQLGTTIDAVAVEPYLGAFANDILGEITVAYADNTLTVDAGEFKTRLLPYSDKDGKFKGYIQADAPLQGVIYKFEKDSEGNPVIILGEGDQQYTFHPVK